MNAVKTVFTLYLISSGVLAWDDLSTCNSEYTIIQETLSNRTQDLNECRDDLDDAEDELLLCEKEMRNMSAESVSCFNDISGVRNELVQCRSDVNLFSTLRDDKEKTISALNADKTSLQKQVDEYRKKIDGIDDQHRESIKRWEDKVTFLNEEVVSAQVKIGDQTNLARRLETELNNTRLKLKGTCNEYMANLYYSKWQQLNSGEKDCLEKVMARDTIAFATSDGKNSILLICDLSLSYAQRYLTRYQELGFIEKDPTTQFTIQEEYKTDVKEYMSMVGYFHPVDFPIGCVRRFRDLDDTYQAGKNSGGGITFIGISVLAGLAVIGKSFVERVLTAY